jgi:hypothetical protein
VCAFVVVSVQLAGDFYGFGVEDVQVYLRVALLGQRSHTSSQCFVD